MERRTVRLVNARRLSPTVRELHFEVTRGAPLHYVAGQWVNIYVPVGSDTVRRSYSIASAPAADGQHFEIAVTHVEGGPASSALNTLPIGAELETEGPGGFFTRERAPQNEAAVFVSTGTGLSPFRAMLQDELPKGPTIPRVLLFGCRTEVDILWRDELEAWARAYPNLRYEVTLSRPSDTWRGRTGYVQHHLEEIVVPLKPVQVYICGLSPMVTEVRELLKTKLGFTRTSIHSERYD